MTTTDPFAPPAVPERAPLPPAPRTAVLATLGLAAAGAVLLPGGPPGAGLLLLALLAAGVLARARTGPLEDGWQPVHAVAALLLVAGAVLRDAPWLVALDLLGAAGLAALALRPARGFPAVASALPGLALQAGPGVMQWLGGVMQWLRGARPLLPGGQALGPLARGSALAVLLVAVFLPLLASADDRFAALLDGVPAVRVDSLAARVIIFLVVGVAAAAAVRTLQLPPVELELPPPSRRLETVSEWLLPLGALDLLLGGFVAVQALADRGPSYADELQAGFFQLVVVTVLVLGVVAAAVRWTLVSPGVRATLGGLCLLTLAVDASALSRLHGYTDAYGLTRLRYGVGMVCLGLGALLVLVLVAGLRRAPQPWLPHAGVLVAAAVLLGATALDPDAAIARSGVARGPAADTTYLAGLSADAVPALTALPDGVRDCVLAQVAERLSDASWTSANLSRARAARLLAGVPVAC